ncbi:Uncharacterized protein SCF082_LOCUS48947 [Durusdinium trenchii]|uniref:Uncharacterized protein n=1 Tax=Durusdinium trenchii TaxID=1381693 RepID=A0ABP0RYQ9_9DINO
MPHSQGSLCITGDDALSDICLRPPSARLPSLLLDVPRRQGLHSFFEGQRSTTLVSSFSRRFDAVNDPDGGAIIEETRCKRPDMDENVHGTGLKAGIQLGLSTIFVLGIPIGIVGGFFYQVYAKAAEVRKAQEAKAAAEAAVAAKAKAKAKFKMKAKAKPKAQAAEDEEESYSDEDD